MQCFQGTTKSQYEQDMWDQARSNLSADLSAIMQLTDLSLKFKRNTWDEDRFENHEPRGGLLETRKSFK